MRSVLAATLLCVSTQVLASETQLDEMMELIRQQQAQIAALQAQVNEQASVLESLQGEMQKTAEVSAEANQKAEILAEAVENQSTTELPRYTLGGYGELHVNQLENQLTGADKNEIDLHRFVMFYGYRFNDRLRFNSELEVEHALAGDGEPGEVEVEQAYVEYDWMDNHSLRAGLFLLPVGFLNETHEPTTFYGVERNPVESRIIPTTWWEGGVSFQGALADAVRYDFSVSSGLFTGPDNNYAVRSGRQKGAQARFDSLAYTGRVRWLGLPGLELAASVQYQEDITQETDPLAGGAWLYNAQASWQTGAFGLRALYAKWDLEGAGPAAVGADRQEGWFVEPSWRFSENWGLFARYSQWDNLAGSASDTQFEETDIGVNYWLHPQVVFKLDYQNQDAPPGQSEFDGWNLGFGYQF